MVDIFTPEQKIHIVKLFNKMDDNNSGKITPKELVKFCKKAGHHLDFERAVEIVRDNDDGSGKLDFEHFCIAIAKSFIKLKYAFILVALFTELDTNDSGYISTADLIRLTQQTEVDLSLREIHDIIDTLDKTGDGLVSFGEFAVGFVKLLRDR